MESDGDNGDTGNTDANSNNEPNTQRPPPPTTTSTPTANTQHADSQHRHDIYADGYSYGDIYTDSHSNRHGHTNSDIYADGHTPLTPTANSNSQHRHQHRQPHTDTHTDTDTNGDANSHSNRHVHTNSYGHSCANVDTNTDAYRRQRQHQRNSTPAPINVSGAISYCSNPVAAPVPDVTLNLTGDMTTSTVSDGFGNYQFSSLVPGGSYTVTPTKAALAPGSAGISTVDVVATQRHFLNIAPLPPGCQLSAADVNGDAVINVS